MATLTKVLVPRTALYLLSCAHGLHDLYTGIWLLVVAAQVNWLDMSYTQSSIAAATYILVSAIMQPSFGSFFDRNGNPYLALWAVAWTTMMVALAALAPHFGLLVLAGGGAGLGSAAFHAAGLSNAKQLASGRGTGRATAIFLVGGNAGFALGAYIGGRVLDDASGKYGLFWLAVGVSLTAPILIYWLRPFLSDLINPPKRTTMEMRQADHRTWLPLIAFVLISLTREVVRAGYATFLPQYYEASGNSLEYAGTITALFLFFAAMGGLVGGMLSDRLPRRGLAVMSLMVIAPLSFLLLRSEGIALVIMSILLGLAINISLPIMLIIGQEIFPGGANGAGGYAFGTTFLMGGIATLVLGPVADQMGLLNTLTVVGLMPLLTLGLFYFLPARAL